MNTPLRKIDIENLKPGEEIKAIFPNRKRRRLIKNLPCLNNRKYNKSRHIYKFVVNSYEYAKDSNGNIIKIKNSKKLLTYKVHNINKR